MTKFSLKSKIGLVFPMSAKDKSDISLLIESVYNSHEELSYMEILAQWAEDNDLDASEVPACLCDVLRQKIFNEATELHMMKAVHKSNSLSLNFLM